MSLRSRLIPLALSATLVVAMVAVSQLAGSAEVLFPEITAILCGAWVLPRQAWEVDRQRMLALMAAGSVFGLTLNLWVPLPLWPRAVLAYAFCACAMSVAGASMAPMLSSAILPVLLSTESWVYPLAVVALVGLVCAGQVALERAGLREKIDFVPRRTSAREALLAWGPRVGAFALASAPAYLSGNPLFAVPPLVVAFTELSWPNAGARRKPVRAWAVLALAAVAGDAGRSLVELLGTSPVVAVLPCLVCLVAIWAGLDTWLPPAGAVALLAFLAPYVGPGTYALEVATGAAVWVGMALAFPGVRPGRRLPGRTDRRRSGRRRG